MIGENKGIYISLGNNQVCNVQRDAGIIETSLNIIKTMGKLVAAKTKDSSLFQTRADQATAAIAKLAAEKEQAKTTYPEFSALSRAALAKTLDQQRAC